MTYEERIRQERPRMSKSFAKLADFLLDCYVEASFMTASELAQQLNLDAATVVRFSQHLGYGGYPKLQREIRQRVMNDLLIRPVEAQDPDSVAGIVSATMRELIRSLEQISISLDTTAMERLVNMIDQARRVILVVEAPAQPAAYNLMYFLEQGGFSVFIARPGVADLARTIHTASLQDIILAIDVAGESPNIARALAEAQSKGIPTASIVGAASIASARAADVVLEAQANPSVGIGIVAIESVIYALIQVLRNRFAERFAGAEQAIAEISERIQQA